MIPVLTVRCAKTDRHAHKNNNNSIRAQTKINMEDTSVLGLLPSLLCSKNKMCGAHSNQRTKVALVVHMGQSLKNQVFIRITYGSGLSLIWKKKRYGQKFEKV